MRGSRSMGLAAVIIAAVGGCQTPRHDVPQPMAVEVHPPRAASLHHDPVVKMRFAPGTLVPIPGSVTQEVKTVVRATQTDTSN